MSSAVDSTAADDGFGRGAAAPAKEARWRRIVPDVLLTLATILTVLGIVSIWANRLLLNPNNWASTSTQLLQNKDIRTTTANYLVAQLYENVDIQSRLGDALPKQLSPLAGPISGALRSAATDGAELALQQPVVQSIWRLANRSAAQAFLTLVEGGNNHVQVNQGAVTLNIGQMLNDVAAQLGLGSNLNLPANAASITVVRSDQLKTVQDGGRILRRLPLVLTLVVIAMYVAAMLIARKRRRRQVMYIGWSLIIAGLGAILIRSVLVSLVPGAVTDDAAVVPAARATVSIATGMLVDVAWGAVALGVLFAIAAWFAGPMRWAVTARRLIAPFLRREPVATYAIAAGILLLLFIWHPLEALGRPLGILVFTVLAVVGVTVLRGQTAREFPAPVLVAGGGVGLDDAATVVDGDLNDPPTEVDGGLDDPPTVVDGPMGDSPTVVDGPSGDSPTVVGGPSGDSPTVVGGPSGDSPTVVGGPSGDPPTVADGEDPTREGDVG